MPSLEQIYEKLDILERKFSNVQDGFSILDDTVADFFNINTLPGREPENAHIEKLDNVVINDGIATIIEPASDGFLLTAATNFGVDRPRTVSLRPVGEDIRAQYLISPSNREQDTVENYLYFEQNSFSENIEIIANNGQRDYGAKLNATETTFIPYNSRWSFEDGGLDNLWMLEKTNILWETIDLSGSGDTYVLQCTATNPIQTFSLPQYNLGHVGMALWGDIKAKEISEITATMNTTNGNFVRMGLAIRMKDALNGYMALLESDISDSYVNLYKIKNGFISKIAQQLYSGDFVLNRDYEVNAKANDNNIQIYIDGILVLDVLLEPLDIVTTSGDFGIVTMATSTTRFAWIETIGNVRNVIIPSDGIVTTTALTVSDIAQWVSLELDSSIFQGKVELDYSLDLGLTFTPIPMAEINYPEPITKTFDLTNIPILPTPTNSIIIRARIFQIGSTGWLRGITIKHLTVAELPYTLDNIIVYDDTFRLDTGMLTGSLTTKHFVPQQIYAWDKIIPKQVQETILDPIVSLNELASVMVDSHQDPYVGDFIIDSDLVSYWESRRGADSWVIFEYATLVEIHQFRWVKKSATDAATFYSFQVFNEETGEFDVVQTFGYEVNADITHILDTPTKGTKFRIFINCTQPMSFGNARFIDLIGKAVISSSALSYQYSLNNGNTFVNLNSLSLAELPINQGIMFRINFNRTNPNAVIYLREAALRFIGRDKNAIQITNLQYDLSIGDKFIYNLTPYTATDIACISGNSVQLKIIFLIHPDYRFDCVKPWLSGYRIGVSCSQYQEQIDVLQAHINSVILRADRNPNKDLLVDAILGLIAQEIENVNQNETDVDKIILKLMSYLNIEVSKNRSNIVLGDVGHLDEAMPSDLFDANILL